jgi:hypothetical protein
MDGLLFLLTVIASGIAIHWSHQNDLVSIRGETKGLLALRGTNNPPKKASRWKFHKNTKSAP